MIPDLSRPRRVFSAAVATVLGSAWLWLEVPENTCLLLALLRQ